MILPFLIGGRAEEAIDDWKLEGHGACNGSWEFGWDIAHKDEKVEETLSLLQKLECCDLMHLMPHAFCFLNHFIIVSNLSNTSWDHKQLRSHISTLDQAIFNKYS